MKRLALFVTCLSIFVFAPTLYAQGAEAADENAVVIGERFSIQSDILEEERPYWVYLPASYEQERFAPQRYPVMYILDGDAHFHSASGVVQFMSTGINGNMQTPEMIVVAVPNTPGNRTRDLTPTHTTVGYDGDEAPGLASSGGGDRFLEFIRDELFPKIESTYRTRPYRVLVGHSFGGLLALHALVNAPGMFQSHIAIDPSLWWDEQQLVAEAERFFADSQDLEGALYITLANNPTPDGETNTMLEAGQEFARSAEAVSGDRFRAAHLFYEREDHGSVPLVSLYDGLLHVFDGYKPSIAALLEDPTSLETHFAGVSRRLGMEFLPPEAIVNNLGYALMGQMDDVEGAIVLFEMNAANYPESYNVHDSLGEAYEANGDNERAIASFEKSLELNPDNENARTRIEALGGGA